MTKEDTTELIQNLRETYKNNTEFILEVNKHLDDVPIWDITSTEPYYKKPTHSYRQHINDSIFRYYGILNPSKIIVFSFSCGTKSFTIEA